MDKVSVLDIPTIERLMQNAGGSDTLSEGSALWFRDSLAVSYANAEALYQEALSRGVPLVTTFPRTLALFDEGRAR